MQSLFLQACLSYSSGLLVVVFTLLLLHWIRKKPQIAGFRSQRMCPSCGLITSRLKALCLECVASFSERQGGLTVKKRTCCFRLADVGMSIIAQTFES